MNLQIKINLPKVDIGIVISNLVVFLYLLPLLIVGQNSFVGVNDDLDAHIIWYKILESNGLVFADSFTPISEIMDAPRLSLGNEFFLLFWIHYLFDTFPAIVINKFVIHFVALWGMYLFLSELKLSRVAVSAGALFFALLPFSQYWGISIAGQPLVLYLFFRINRDGIKFKYLVLLLIYVLYSNFYSVSMFFLAATALYHCIKFIDNRSVDWNITGIIIFLFCLSLAMEYRLIESLFFDHSYVSARVERRMDHLRIDPLQLPKLILLGHFTARTFLIFLFPLLIYSGSLMYRNNEFKFDWRLKFMFVLFILIIVFAEIPYVKMIQTLYGDTFLNIFQFQRVHTILPFWSAIMMACSTDYLTKYVNAAVRPYVMIYLFGLVCIIWSTNPAIRPLFPKNPLIAKGDIISFKGFFAEELFKEINEYIGLDKKSYKVASLGLYPSISQYNSFHTLDGYLTNYPLAYKNEFRKIIQGELSNNDDIRIYFDEWGSRCYLFDDELGINFLFTKDKSKSIGELNISCDQFKKMGGRFIFSAVTIKSFPGCESVKFHRSFEDAHWKIYLYEIL